MTIGLGATRPCPMCGAANADVPPAPHPHEVPCTGCGEPVPFPASSPADIAAWNQRQRRRVGRGPRPGTWSVFGIVAYALVYVLVIVLIGYFVASLAGVSPF